MAQPRLTGKFVTTLNLVLSDVEIARQLAEARGVSTASVLREAMRIGLPRLVARDQEFLAEEVALAHAGAKVPQELETAARHKHF